VSSVGRGEKRRSTPKEGGLDLNLGKPHGGRVGRNKKGEHRQLKGGKGETAPAPKKREKKRWSWN